MLKNLNNRILLSISGPTSNILISKIHELDKLKITKAALFVSCIGSRQNREKVYEELLKSKIKYIPLVHIRDEVDKDELIFLKKKFKTKCFNFHEVGFHYLEKWHGFYKNLYLELNTDGFVSKQVQIKKIGGFCIDVSHLMVAKTKNLTEYEYITKMKRRNIFTCNHVSGYSPTRVTDLHEPKKLSDFDYLKEIPEFVFGKYIAIEINNPIKDQIEIKKYIIKLLS